MSFLAPWFFWSFLSLIPLVAVYFLKVRPRKKETTAYFLWQRVFTEKKATSLFSRLRDAFSLILMALVFGAVCMALTKPELTTDTRKDLMLLIDNSASMSAGSGGSQRLEMARKAAVDLIRGLDGTQRAGLATVASEVRFLSHLSDDPRALLDALEKVKPSSLPFLPSALQALFAGKSEDWSKGHRMILITDGCLDAKSLPPNIEVMKVGQALENAGIVSADAAFLPGSTNRLGIYFQLASSYKNNVKADLVVKRIDAASEFADLAEHVEKVIPVEITPGLNKSETFSLDDAEPGRWVLQLELNDALSDDNKAFLVAARPKPVRVMVDAQNRFFLEACVQAFSTAGGLLFLAEENPQLTLAIGRSPDAPLALIFDPEGTGPWWNKVGEPLASTVARVKIQDHSALRHLDPTSLNFAGAKQLELPEGALVLVENDQGAPLIYTVSAGGKAAMVVNMDPMAAEFYYSALFPLLVHSAATHLAAREENLAATYAPGASIPVPGAQEGEATQITPPVGAAQVIRDKRYGPLDQPGFYQLTNESGQWLAACSLLTAGETILDNSATQNTLQPIAKGWPPYLLLTLLAIVILIAESVLYHRRKVG